MTNLLKFRKLRLFWQKCSKLGKLGRLGALQTCIHGNINGWVDVHANRPRKKSIKGKREI